MLKKIVSNNKLEFDDKGGFFYKEKLDVVDQENENQTFCFNIQFHRSYERYYFLELIIFKEILLFNYTFKNIKWYIELIKNIPLLFAKQFLVELYTKKITQLIQSDKIKKYKF